MCVVEMLHRLSTEVDAEVLQLTGLQHEGETWDSGILSAVPVQQQPHIAASAFSMSNRILLATSLWRLYKTTEQI
jgi:hypothetical protein